MRKLSLFLILLFFLILCAAAQINVQQNGSGPSVSHIRAEARHNLIRLTWIDSPDARGPVYIFRSARPFASAIPANIRPVVVDYGQQYYIDDTEDMTNLYYFIAASDVSGFRYNTIIPQVNSTFINLALSQTSDVPPLVTEAIEHSQPSVNLTARQDGEKVVLTYESASPSKNAILYRSALPIRQPQDLRSATVVQSTVRFPFVDFPVPGFLWYYAVVYEEDISSGNMGIRPGVNATVSPIMIPTDVAVQGAMRPIPLPMLSLRDSYHDGFFMTDIPQTAFLNTWPQERDNRRQQKPPLELKKPRVFVIDLEATAGGEASALVQIVQEYFVKLDWEGTRTSLLHYLSLPRSNDVEARARFYLGQSFYYTANYREALLEFLSFRSFHPAEANVWIEAVLAAMVY